MIEFFTDPFQQQANYHHDLLARLCRHFEFSFVGVIKKRRLIHQAKSGHLRNHRHHYEYLIY